MFHVEHSSLNRVSGNGLLPLYTLKHGSPPNETPGQASFTRHRCPVVDFVAELVALLDR